MKLVIAGELHIDGSHSLAGGRLRTAPGSRHVGAARRATGHSARRFPWPTCPRPSWHWANSGTRASRWSIRSDGTVLAVVLVEPVIRGKSIRGVIPRLPIISRTPAYPPRRPTSSEASRPTRLTGPTGWPEARRPWKSPRGANSFHLCARPARRTLDAQTLLMLRRLATRAVLAASTFAVDRVEFRRSGAQRAMEPARDAGHDRPGGRRGEPVLRAGPARAGREGADAAADESARRTRQVDPLSSPDRAARSGSCRAAQADRGARSRGRRERARAEARREEEKAAEEAREEGSARGLDRHVDREVDRQARRPRAGRLHQLGQHGPDHHRESAGATRDYFEFRRLRLLADGTGYGVYDFRLQIDIEPESGDGVTTPVTDIKDAYFSMNELPGNSPLAHRQLLRAVQPRAGDQRHEQHLPGAVDSDAGHLRRRPRSRHGLLRPSTTPRTSTWTGGMLLRQHQRIAQGADRRQPGPAPERPAHLLAVLRRAVERPLPGPHRLPACCTPTTRTTRSGFAPGRRFTKGRS